MNALNLNYLRGLYDYLLGKSDEELEDFDINLPANRKVLFEEMKRIFLKLGPISKNNIIDGINFIIANYSNENLWKNAIPHDLPLDRVIDRREYLEAILFVLTNSTPSPVAADDFFLVDEIGPQGLNYSE